MPFVRQDALRSELLRALATKGDAIHQLRVCSSRLATAGVVPMSVFALDKEHPLTRFIRVVEKVELGLKSGDVVFEFPYGRIVDNGMACRRERIIPPGVEIMTIHKEALAARASCKKQEQEGKHINVLQFGRAV